MTGRFRNDSKNLRHDPQAGQCPVPAMFRNGGTGFRRACLACFVILACAFGAVMAWAGNGGPTSPNITLDVHDHASSGSDGYTNTTASNGAVYSYRYSGGEGKGGDVIFRTRGRVTVNVRMVNGSAYTIENVGFLDDTHHQLSWLDNHGKAASAVIQDKNDALQTARYKITVEDQAGNVTVPCDPIIANRN